MIESLLIVGVACASFGAVFGAVLSLLRKPTNDTSWRKEQPRLNKINYVDNGVDHLGRKEPTL
jgi:hypothetical protein